MTLRFWAEELEGRSCHQEREGGLWVSRCGSFFLDMFSFRHKLDMKVEMPTRQLVIGV